MKIVTKTTRVFIEDYKGNSVGEMVNTYKRLAENKIKITSSKDAFNVLQPQFEEMVDTREEFRALYISRANEVICCNLISIGDESQCIVSVQEIIRGALMCKAQGIILAHNHPSGATNPSEADKRITKQIKQAAELFNISVLDHLILSRNSYHSFSDEGEL